MSVIIRTEEVLNRYGDLVKLIHHYKDGSKGERKVFISAKELVRIECVKKRWLGKKC